MSTDIETPFPGYFSKVIPLKLLSSIYKKTVVHRNNKFDKNNSLSYKSKLPVISVGGIRAGGTGKTPLTQYIAEYLTKLNYNVAVLSRGYRRKDKKDRIVHPFQKAPWEMVGDEPAMLHANVPQSYLAVSAKRITSAKRIEKIAPSNTILLLDDGFQHRKLKRDLDIICLNESILSEKLLPLGYLREPFDSLRRSHALVLIGAEDRLDSLKCVANQLNGRFPEIPVFIAVQSADCWVNAITGEKRQTLPFKEPVAFCGIARPERFFNLLSTQGVNPIKKFIFQDHHKFTHYDIESIHKLYSHGLVTTEKDAFRLLNNNFDPELKLWYLKIKLSFENENSLNRFNSLICTVTLNI